MLTLDAKERDRRAAIVAQNGGILPNCDAVYNLSVRYLAEQGKQAFDRHIGLVEDGSPPDGLIATVQTAVGHSAALPRHFLANNIGVRTKYGDWATQSRARETTA